MISFFYPLLLAVALYFALVITAFYSELDSPPVRSRIGRSFRSVHSLVWTPPFLRHWQFMKQFFSLTIATDAPNPPSTARHDQVRFESLCDFWTIPIGLPFKWELLWLASFLFFLAFAVYMIACPYFVRRFPSYSAYLDVGNSVRWIVWEFYHMNTLPEVRRSIEQRLILKEHAIWTNRDVTPRPCVTKDNTYLVFEHGDQKYLFGSPRPNVPEDEQRRWEQDVFWEVFEGWTKSRPLFASLIRWLLRGAGALAVYAVLQNIVAALYYIV